MGNKYEGKGRIRGYGARSANARQATAEKATDMNYGPMSVAADRLTAGFEDSADERMTGGEDTGSIKQENEYIMRNSYQQRGGERHLHMKFAGNAVSPYEKNVILENQCPAFVEMYAARNGTDLDVYYKMTGCVSLGSYLKKNSPSESEILKITAELLKLIKSCEDYLMFPEYIPIKIDYVFVSTEQSLLRLMYLPGYRTTRPLKTLLAGFLDDAAAVRENRRDEGILAEYRRQILMSEYGLRDYINIAEDLIRQNLDAPRAEESAHEELSDEIFLEDDESNYFSEKISGMISVKERIIDFVENILS